MRSIRFPIIPPKRSPKVIPKNLELPTFPLKRTYNTKAITIMLKIIKNHSLPLKNPNAAPSLKAYSTHKNSPITLNDLPYRKIFVSWSTATETKAKTSA